jgi:hypothetical protein
MRRIVLTAAAACVLGWCLLASVAWAGEPGPGWVITSRGASTDFSAKANALSRKQGDGYTVIVRNSGSKPTNGGVVTITDTLPAGIIPVQVEGYDIGPGFASFVYQQNPVKLNCALHQQSDVYSVTCTDGQTVGPGDVIDVSIEVTLAEGLKEGEEVVNAASVSGGGAPPARTSLSTKISSVPASFGFESMSLEATGADGLTDAQAGDHPYEFTTSFSLNTMLKPSIGGEEPIIQSVEDPRDVVTDLPAGFVGDPQVVAKCSQEAAQAEARLECPAASQIGIARVYRDIYHTPAGEDFVVPIYNVVPDKGVVAQFVFTIGPVPTTLFVVVNQETNYAVRVIASGIPRVAELTGIAFTFFGEPLTDPDVYNESVGADPVAFLQNPMDCAAGPLEAKVSIDSWQHPGSYLPDGSPNLEDPNWKTSSTTVYPSMTGCDMLQFEPSITVTPDTTRADEPTGVNVDLHVSQATNRFPALATPELENATVTLPAGLTLSPSAADGLQACSDAQIDVDSIEPGDCPEGSVLGTVKVDVPSLETPLEGQVYLGSPNCDPCNSSDAADGNMLRIYIEAAGSGVRLKKEGHIYANPSTGQLTSTFEDNPQDPFENLELDFKGGLRAGLATPQSCGQATTTSDLVPWSAPITPAANPTSSFNVDWDGNGGACPAVAPLSPSFSAGTSNPNAGQFSPFTLTFGREDREQDLSAIQVHMPPGLLGTLTGVPLCGEPQASLGTCSTASQIGSMTVAAGPGSHPFYEKGEVYLTGPYGGAPFGLSIVVPTVAGPFNLGNVVVRARINIDPDTAALTVTSDPFPQVIDGIPLRLRTANVTIERPGFIFNPTNCAQLQVSATIAGAQGAQAQVSAPFAVAGCAGLHFGPTFKVSTSGKTSRKDGASLDARLTFPVGAQSNIAKVKVELPKQLPSELKTLQKACLAGTFEANPAACPTASVIGVVRASTPVLPVALTGPVYFVSHAGEEFPTLIAVLQGYGVRVDLIGKTFISKAGITSSTFENVPDVPVSSFELYLPEGPYSALAATGNLCTQKLLMPTLFTAQDGAQLKQKTPITVTGCPKTKAKPKRKIAKTANKARTAGRAKKAGRAAARARTAVVAAEGRSVR